jgi:hypothetical protein
MDLAAIRFHVRAMDIAPEDDLVFKAAVILLCVAHRGDFRISWLFRFTRYAESDCELIMRNLRDNEIIQDDILYAEWGDRITGGVEFVLMALCGAGQISRSAPREYRDITTSDFEEDMDRFHEALHRKSPDKLVRPLPNRPCFVIHGTERFWIQPLELQGKLIIARRLTLPAPGEAFKVWGRILWVNVSDIMSITGIRKDRMEELKAEIINAAAKPAVPGPQKLPQK